MNIELILPYLSQLSQNNNREWYHGHKEDYRAANAQFEALVGELMLDVCTFESSVPYCQPKELTFKLVRDTRFSHDKSPYNPAFRAHISAKGKLPIPVGYYIMIKPDNRSFLGGGLFADMFKDATAMVRDYISDHPEAWSEMIGDTGFKNHFTVGGTVLKNVPPGYDKEHPQGEFLKHKSWYLEYPMGDEVFGDGARFLATAGTIFRKMKPFNDYLNRALVDFRMPERGGK